MLNAGIVGLPNVGKSTLFNALTRSRKAEAANYPFCTIDPNVGVVTVPDDRVHVLKKIAKTQVVIPAAIEFVDIAGLVAGASQGEGLGNRFLSHIREMDALVHLVRCFADENILHGGGTVDALRDLEIVRTELLLADLESLDRQLERNRKKAKGMDREAMALCESAEKLKAHISGGGDAGDLPDDPGKAFCLLTAKPVLYACNVGEGELADPNKNGQAVAVENFVRGRRRSVCCRVSARLEEELVDLTAEESENFLASLGVRDGGVGQLIRGAYGLLTLSTFFTAGEKEARAWTFRRGMRAPECAGIIHSDFERGFICAEVISYEDLRRCGSPAAARAAGHYRVEGKNYIFQDGDVVEFRFQKSR
jgi:GTP-binding protein YchF